MQCACVSQHKLPEYLKATHSPRISDSVFSSEHVEIYPGERAASQGCELTCCGGQGAGGQAAAAPQVERPQAAAAGLHGARRAAQGLMCARALLSSERVAPACERLDGRPSCHTFTRSAAHANCCFCSEYVELYLEVKCRGHCSRLRSSLSCIVWGFCALGCGLR